MAEKNNYICRNIEMTRQPETLQEKQAKELLRKIVMTTVNVDSEQLDPLIKLAELVKYRKIMSSSRNAR